MAGAHPVVITVTVTLGEVQHSSCIGPSIWSKVTAMTAIIAGSRIGRTPDNVA